MAVTTIPPDYAERVYAGVLGKLIGVYLGRPFEGWTHQEIMEKLGHIRYYVHNKLDVPLVVADDDVSGTFVFPRALEEHGVTPNISAEQIGKTWLNNIIEGKTILAWAGRGILTEPTAYLNLKKGIKAPASGSIAVNGKTLAEQIGAQIFIDGWPMIVPGNPDAAAKLAEAAGTVSHDGESVHAAKLWAAMESEAFVSSDVNHLLDIGLSYVPRESLVTKLVNDIRGWAKEDGDWLKTRQRIEDNYGYDKFPGLCHVIPNHGLMISALIYGGHDFHEAVHIINTCGWDTDCNSGNVACLVALMHGMKAFDNGPDWRGPLADRAVISSADGGISITNAAAIAERVAKLGLQMAGKSSALPKDGAQFHFTLPGSVQGFMAADDAVNSGTVKVYQGLDHESIPGLNIEVNNTTTSSSSLEVMTDTFTSTDILRVPFYSLMATPLVSPGQTVQAIVKADPSNSASITVALALKHFNEYDTVSTMVGPSISLTPATSHTLSWTIPDTLDSQPIQCVGLSISPTPSGGKIVLSSLSYGGTPTLTLTRPALAQSHPFHRNPKDRPCTFWQRAWIHNFSTFHTVMPGGAFLCSHNEGEGICMTGTREWTDYQVRIPKLRIDLGGAGVAIRIHGVNRWYALVWEKDRKGLALIKARDEERQVLAHVQHDWELDQACEVTLSADGDRIVATVGGKVLEARDSEYRGGGFGLLLFDGCAAVDRFEIGPCADVKQNGVAHL